MNSASTPPSHDEPAVVWRFAATAAELTNWERAPAREAVAVEYRVLGTPPGEWWRVRVVTQAWLRGLLAVPYTAHGHPALLIIPDGPLASRRDAITRLLSPGPALDLSRVAEPVAEPVPEPVATPSTSRDAVAEHPPDATA